MPTLKRIRVLLATLFFVATVAYIIFGPQNLAATRVAEGSQILFSAVSVTIGTTLFWLLTTFIFGRVYCGAVCPVGILTDIVGWVSRRIGPRRRRTFSYRPQPRFTIHILIVFVISLLVGLTVVPFILEPWNMVSNVAALAHPEAIDRTWGTLGIGVGVAFAVGVAMLVVVVVYAALAGRNYCTDICPIGSAMSLLADRTLYHIEIDPDSCVSCGECEDRCPASCVKVVSRYVDDGRCVRCFECIAVCRHNAIRFQPNRNRRPATPLMRKRQRSF